MKETKALLVFLSIILFCNCTNNRNIKIDNDALIVKMDINNPVNIHDINFIDSIDILRLSNDVILGKVDKIIINNNLIFLLNRYAENSVFVYDVSGKFIKQISNLGQGPEEYLQPTDIFIDNKQNVLALVSRMDRKLLKYNLDNLNLISVEKLSKPFFNLIDIENGYAGFMNNLIDEQPFNLWTMSNTLELQNSFFEIPDSWDSKASGNIQPFSKYNDKVYYIQPYDLNVYHIDKDDIKIAYKYDLGDFTWPSDMKEYEDVKRVLESSSDRYIQDFYMFQETQNYLISRVVFKNQELLGIYNKKTEKSCVAKPEAYSDKYLIPFGRIIGMDEKAIYSLVDAESVKRNIIGKDEYNDFESMYPTQIKNLREKFKGISISEEDNSFLLIHYFNVN